MTAWMRSSRKLGGEQLSPRISLSCKDQCLLRRLRLRLRSQRQQPGKTQQSMTMWTRSSGKLRRVRHQQVPLQIILGCKNPYLLRRPHLRSQRQQTGKTQHGTTMWMRSSRKLGGKLGGVHHEQLSSGCKDQTPPHPHPRPTATVTAIQNQTRDDHVDEVVPQTRSASRSSTVSSVVTASDTGISSHPFIGFFAIFPTLLLFVSFLSSFH
ncbi:hypothetical protein EDB86DRAFT_711207 [Lactarius hatsudake]|nr:hypothetical protein EDB86DRAFT_711207 [Lactarius hatsudake]